MLPCYTVSTGKLKSQHFYLQLTIFLLQQSTLPILQQRLCWNVYNKSIFWDRIRHGTFNALMCIYCTDWEICTITFMWAVDIFFKVQKCTRQVFHSTYIYKCSPHEDFEIICQITQSRNAACVKWEHLWIFILNVLFELQ